MFFRIVQKIAITQTWPVSRTKEVIHIVWKDYKQGVKILEISGEQISKSWGSLLASICHYLFIFLNPNFFHISYLHGDPLGLLSLGLWFGEAPGHPDCHHSSLGTEELKNGYFFEDSQYWHSCYAFLSHISAKNSISALSQWTQA